MRPLIYAGFSYKLFIQPGKQLTADQLDTVKSAFVECVFISITRCREQLDPEGGKVLPPWPKVLAVPGGNALHVLRAELGNDVADGGRHAQQDAGGAPIE